MKLKVTAQSQKIWELGETPVIVAQLGSGKLKLPRILRSKSLGKKFRQRKKYQLDMIQDLKGNISTIKLEKERREYFQLIVINTVSDETWPNL